MSWLQWLEKMEGDLEQNCGLRKTPHWHFPCSAYVARRAARRTVALALRNA